MPKLMKRVRKHLAPLAGAALIAWGGATKSAGALARGWRMDPLSYRALRGILRRQGRDVELTDRLYHAIGLIAATPSSAGPAIHDLLSWSESQLGQDMLAALAHGLKKGGYFVEVGVGNGKTISNTYMLEKQFGWHGLLVEPSRSFHDSIRQHRSATLEVRAATSRDGDTVTFNEAVGEGVFSYVQNAKSKAQERQSTRQFVSYPVSTATLNTILAEANAPQTIDFLSLDTEGSELDILKGLDLDRHRVGLMCIEHNHRKGMVETLDSQLLGRSYRRILAEVSDYDAWYLHESIRSDYL